MDSRLFSVSESLEERIWLQAMKKVLDVAFLWLLSIKDFGVKLSNFILNGDWDLFGLRCVDSLCNLNDERVVVTVFFANLSELVLFNLLFILSIFLFDLVRVLFGLLDVGIESIGPEGKDNENEEESKCEPSFGHGDISWGNTAQAKV